MNRTLRTLAASLLLLASGACETHEGDTADKPPSALEQKQSGPLSRELTSRELPPTASSKPEATLAPQALAFGETPGRKRLDPGAERLVSEELNEKACYALGLRIASSLAQQGVKVDTDAVGRGIADGVAGKPKMNADELRATMEAYRKRMREGDAGEADENTCYALGLDVARNLGGQGLDLVPERLSRGIADGVAGKPGMDETEIEATMIALKGHMEKKAERLAGENLQKGRAWLAENAKRPGVTTLPSSLQYEVLRAGRGRSPGPHDRVTTHYRGTLIDGTVFDSSFDRGKPATFAVGRVIRGWTEALQLMKVGAKWKLYVPPRLGYGKRPPRGSPIGPNDVLIFELELLGIK